MAVLALPGVVLADFATPVELFSRATGMDGGHPYEVVTCGPTRRVRSTACVLTLQQGLAALRSADTVIVSGVEDVQAPLAPDMLQGLRRAVARGSQVASICSGAFVLAAAGLLDDRPATTHWRLAEELARRYPRVQVKPDVLYVDDGQLITSAGATAAVDLCLHLIRKDQGAAVAAQCARNAVAPLERTGGQAQFIRRLAPSARGSLQPLQDWIVRNLSDSFGMPVLARRHASSIRTLHRRFLQQTGLTPAQWIARRRMQRAQELLETSSLPIDAVAQAVGFAASSTFRQRFRAAVGISPKNYRRLYRPDRPHAVG